MADRPLVDGCFTALGAGGCDCCQDPVKAGVCEREIARCSLFRRPLAHTATAGGLGPGTSVLPVNRPRAQMCLALRTFVRQAGRMPQPLWDSDGLLRRDALWRDADHVLTTRAMTRCALAAGWVALAVLTIRRYAWVGGVGALVRSCPSLLHASHTLVGGIAQALPRVLRP